jgi:hypothetical protein
VTVCQWNRSLDSDTGSVARASGSDSTVTVPRRGGAAATAGVLVSPPESAAAAGPGAAGPFRLDDRIPPARRCQCQPGRRRRLSSPARGHAAAGPGRTAGRQRRIFAHATDSDLWVKKGGGIDEHNESVVPVDRVLSVTATEWQPGLRVTGPHRGAAARGHAAVAQPGVTAARNFRIYSSVSQATGGLGRGWTRSGENRVAVKVTTRPGGPGGMK